MKEVQIGDVLFRVTDDVVFLRASGVFRLELAQCFVRLTDEVWSQYGHSFVLSDLKHAGPIPADSRRLIAEYGAEKPPLAIAAYQVSTFIRGVNALLFGAMNLLGKKKQNFMQFSTEKAALEWLAAERKRLLPAKD